MIIGLSLSLCVRDILDGKYEINEIKTIITGTRGQDQDDWDSIMEVYGRTHWHQHAPEKYRNVCMQLLLAGKIDQPRTRNEAPPERIHGHWLYI